MEAIVLAGGFGTRLAKVVKDVPKPMAPVADEPFLKYILDDLVVKGIDRIIIAVGYKKEYITNYFGNSYKGVSIIYSDEDSPLFTGGAVKKAMKKCNEENIFIVNGDTFFDINLRDMYYAFNQNDSVIVNIAVKEMRNFTRYGRVDIDKNNKITAFNEKVYCEKGFINGGIYLMKKRILDEYPEKFSLENECFPQLLQDGKIMAYRSSGFFIDIGIPEDYDYAQICFEEKKNDRGGLF